LSSGRTSALFALGDANFISVGALRALNALRLLEETSRWSICSLGARLRYHGALWTIVTLRTYITVIFVDELRSL
jgi:hypothetical protein